MDYLEKLGGLIGGWVTARKNKKAAEKYGQERMDYLNALDWQPTLASERVPTYQKSQSPVARSYLESMLSGANPDLTPDFLQGAADTKAQQQARQNQLYGTPEERVAKQQKINTETPWKVEAPIQSVAEAQERFPELRSIPNFDSSELSTAMADVGSDDGKKLAAYVRERRRHPNVDPKAWLSTWRG